MRRRAMDVLDALPPHRRYTLDMSPPPDSEYAQAESGFVEWWRAQSGKDLAGTGGEALVRIGKLREIAERDKLAVLADALPGDYTGGGETPLLIWHVYQRSYVTLAALGVTLAIHGGQSAEHRARTVERFQSGQGDALSVQIASGSEGVTLTRAAVSLFLSLPWTPSQFWQAEGRMRRIDLDHPTTTIIPQMHGIDRAMVRMLDDKHRTISRVVDRAKGMRGLFELAERITENTEKRI